MHGKGRRNLNQVAIKNPILMMANGRDDDGCFLRICYEFILEQFIIEMVGIKLPINSK